MKHKRFFNLSKLNTIFLVLLIFVSTLHTQTILDPNPQIETIATNIQQPEGPVWKEGIGLLFSDIKAAKIYKWTSGNSSSVFMERSDSTNGLALDLQGRLIAGQMGKRRIVRFEDDGSQTALAEKYNGKRFNSPNDLVCKSDGSIFFTDPDFNIPFGQQKELSFQGIYRISPTGDIQLLDSTFKKPNGICFSPDEKRLYVNESPTGDIYVWDVVNDTSVANKKWFAKHRNNGYVDGMKIDQDGNLFCTGPKGVEIFSPKGVSIGFITLPNNNSASNCAWGEADNKTLFITSGGQNKPVFRVRPFLTDVQKGEGNLLPGKFELEQNFPNPFNPSTVIGYNLRDAGNVILKVYDSLGNEISTLVNEYQNPGSYQSTFNAGNSLLASGIFFYRLTINGLTLTKKMLCLK